MHPILASRAGLLTYLLAWTPIAFMMAAFARAGGSPSWSYAIAGTLPNCIIYAFICLSPWYLCRVMPVEKSPPLRLLTYHLAAATFASLVWIVCSKGLAILMERWFPGMDRGFGQSVVYLFGIGVMLYMLFVALHYVLLAIETSREAERRAHEARTFAREAELRALKAQINPHFLFNSLNSISALSTSDGARAREMCIRLSEFLRTTLNLGNRETITLAEEVALARVYLSVEQVRFGARLHVEQTVDPSCGSCEIPSLLLQPLVENAIKHGIASLVDGGTVRLAASCGNGSLNIRVENEFDADAPEPRRSGVGLTNIRGRLKARYDSRARLDTEVRGDCFAVQLNLPCTSHHHA